MKTLFARRWLAALGLLALAAPARAADTWTRPYDGVRHLHRTTGSPKWDIHALVVDLTVPGVHLGATTSGQRKRTTSSFVKAVSAQAGVNGDFFSFSSYATSGLAAGGGAAWNDTKDTTGSGNLAFDKSTRVELHRPSEVLPFAGWMYGVVSGHPQIVSNGVVANRTDSFCTTRHPRTAVGLSADGKTLYVAVVDGRQASSVGMTCGELGNLLKGLGADDALNLDGGGSTAMYIAGQGIVNSPSDGSERVVGNHLAIFAPKLGSTSTLTGYVHEAGAPSKRLGGAKVKLDTGATVVAEADGVYEFNLPPGTYTATASFTGHVSAAVTKKLAAGATVTANIPLEVALAPTDLDEDGAPDAKDNCPERANPDQLDTDRDGLGDACDLDDDNDGRADEDDNCPFAANPDQADGDGDDIGDVCETDGGPDEDGGPGAGLELNGGCTCRAAPGSARSINVTGNMTGDVTGALVLLAIGVASRRRTRG